MRIKDHLRYPNFVVSAMQMEWDELVQVMNAAATAQRAIQSDDTTNINYDDWVGHTTYLMLLRDCLGRECMRRGHQPGYPPMLARGWDTSDMYDIMGLGITLPKWNPQVNYCVRGN